MPSCCHCHCTDYERKPPSFAGWRFLKSCCPQFPHRPTATPLTNWPVKQPPPSINNPSTARIYRLNWPPIHRLWYPQRKEFCFKLPLFSLIIFRGFNCPLIPGIYSLYSPSLVHRRGGRRVRFHLGPLKCIKSFLFHRSNDLVN